MVPGERDSGADGITVDDSGHLYVATRAGVQVCGPTGRLLDVIALPQKSWIAKAVLTGDQMFVTAEDKVFRRRIPAVPLGLVTP
jgi:sugar lactone lactonase YvrE